MLNTILIKYKKYRVKLIYLELFSLNITYIEFLFDIVFFLNEIVISKQDLTS